MASIARFVFAVITYSDGVRAEAELDSVLEAGRCGVPLAQEQVGERLQEQPHGVIACHGSADLPRIAPHTPARRPTYVPDRHDTCRPACRTSTSGTLPFPGPPLVRPPPANSRRPRVDRSVRTRPPLRRRGGRVLGECTDAVQPVEPAGQGGDPAGGIHRRTPCRRPVGRPVGRHAQRSRSRWPPPPCPLPSHQLAARSRRTGASSGLVRPSWARRTSRNSAWYRYQPRSPPGAAPGTGWLARTVRAGTPIRPPAAPHRRGVRTAGRAPRSGSGR